MLLAEHLALRGQLPAGSPAASSFGAIRAFLFGEEYTVELLVDNQVTSYRFDTLGDALDVLTSEFEKNDLYMPDVQIVDYAKTRDPRFGVLSYARGEQRGKMPKPMSAEQATATFEAASNQIPSFGPAPTRVMAVTRIERNTAFPALPMSFFTEDIEKAVTFYSISGTWDQLGGRSNL